VWQVYHITGGLPVVIDLALEVDLLGDEPPAHKVNQLFYLSRESLKKRQIDELWKAQAGYLAGVPSPGAGLRSSR
jgi:hypothetical protein